MISRFEELLEELSYVFQISLHPDKIGACSLKLSDNLIIQLQLDISQENLFLFSKIIELPPGKFKENVLKEALKWNGFPDPRPGILGYLSRTTHLTLHQSYPITMLKGEELAGIIGGFLDYLKGWYQAIQTGQSSPPPIQL